MVDFYEELSNQRKLGQEEGRYPEWFTTGGYQMFQEKYLHEADGFNSQVRRIADTMAAFAPTFLDKKHPYYARIIDHHGDNWADCFYSIFTKGDTAASTPVLANGGTNRGCTVSCSGGIVEDSVKGFYDARKESALLSKEAFGTSAYLGGIRPRGASISKGGKAAGTFPVLRGFQQDARDVSQGGIRRGSWAGYLELDHPDFDEWADALHKNPEGQNIGWIISKDVIQKWIDGDEEMHRRRAKALWVKMMTGKGYFWKVDHVNEQQPQMYKDLGLSNKASNLCTEVTLHADEAHTYTCVLSSMNCYRYDEWVDTGAVFIARVFLDCLCSEFIANNSNKNGLEKAIRFTEKARAVGLGLLGFHSYLQKHMLAFEGFEAHMKNNEIFAHLQEESRAASQWMAGEWGEPEWCKGYDVRGTHDMAIAPNMSSATICMQVSQGIEPWLANIFVQPTAAGEMQRINPEFIKLCERKGKKLTKSLIRDIIEHMGSVQHLDWLTDEEKLVFKTAFEIDQRAILRLASQRQRFIDQGQSLNLFFSADEDEEYIAEIHKEFFLDERLKALYYIRSQAGVQAAKDECISCEA